MRRRNKLLLLTVGCLIALAFVHRAFHKSEPTYRGKSLTQWAQQFQAYRTQEEAAEAFIAIRALCTNGIPPLLDALNYDPTPRRARILAALRWLPSPVRNFLLYAALVDRKQLRAELAATALEVLDPAQTIPGLTKVMDSTNLIISFRGIWTLSLLGTNGLSPLLRAAAEPAHLHRSYVLRAIAHMTYLGTNASPIVPTVVCCTQDRDPRVVEAAVQALGALAIEPDISVPALAATLNHPNSQIRAWAIRSLDRFGLAALPATPALLRALRDPDYLVRRQATNTVIIIAPEVLTSTPAQ